MVSSYVTVNSWKEIHKDCGTFDWKMEVNYLSSDIQIDILL